MTPHRLTSPLESYGENNRRIVLMSASSCSTRRGLPSPALGWAWRRTRRWQLATVTLTALSWFGMGIWYGWGYCPSTDWHWQVRARLGYDNPPSYIQLLLREVVGINLEGPMGQHVGARDAHNRRLTRHRPEHPRFSTPHGIRHERQGHPRRLPNKVVEMSPYAVLNMDPETKWRSRIGWGFVPIAGPSRRRRPDGGRRPRQTRTRAPRALRHYLLLAWVRSTARARASG